MAGDSADHFYKVEVSGIVLVPLPPGSDDELIHATAQRLAEDGYLNAETSLIRGKGTDAEVHA